MGRYNVLEVFTCKCHVISIFNNLLHYGLMFLVTINITYLLIQKKNNNIGSMLVLNGILYILCTRTCALVYVVCMFLL